MHLVKALLLIWLFPTLVHAGAWTKPLGEGFIVTNAVLFSGDEFFDLQGNRNTQERFTKYEINPYIEYGWRNGTTIGANVFLDYVTQDSNAAGQPDSNVGLADTELFIRQRLYEKNGIAIALQPLIKLPSFFQEGNSPKSGDDELAAELSLFAGYSFAWNGQYHFVETRTGYRHRLGELEDQMLLEARLGYRYSDDLLIIPAAYATLSTKLPSNAAFSQNGQNDYNLYKLELGAMYQWDDEFSIHGSSFYHIDGKQTGSGTGVSVGIGMAF